MKRRIARKVCTRIDDDGGDSYRRSTVNEALRLVHGGQFSEREWPNYLKQNPRFAWAWHRKVFDVRMQDLSGELEQAQ